MTRQESKQDNYMVRLLAISSSIILLLLGIVGYFAKKAIESIDDLNRSVIINTEALNGKTIKDTEQDGRIYKLEETTGKHTTDIEIIKSKR